MAESNAPRMPMAASNNMSMSISTVSATSKKLSDLTIDSESPKHDASEATDMESRPGHTKAPATTSGAVASMSSQLKAGVRGDTTRSKEKTLVMQRIQLAEKLSNERKLSTDLEARLIGLQQELATLTSSNEALEAECSRLHGESQATEAKQSDSTMQETIRDLESKLEEAAKNLEQSLIRSDVLQIAHDEAANDCFQQTEMAKQLDDELKISRAETEELHATYKELLDTYKLSESDLEKHLTSKDGEANELRRELDALRTAHADAVSKQAKDFEAQVSQAQKELAEAREQSLAESQKLQKSLDDLQKSTMPFPQAIVIGVDLSGSTNIIFDDIKQAYRDVLLVIKSKNSDARVGVVIHGCYSRPDPSPLEAISDATFRIVDSIHSTGGNEDYSYCLEQANNLFETDGDSKKLLLLIGDGDAMCSDTASAIATCKQLASARTLAHSITLSTSSSFWIQFSMEEISKITGSRVENKDTYLSALDEILRHEREQHFRLSN
ncbi:hypothetical protein F4818DRAFT_304779 [Hypoxylon cercidicola]|nr:hypothetical protein F4818DRAFT_304779 [Hypoxylon cercidicola]